MALGLLAACGGTGTTVRGATTPGADLHASDDVRHERRTVSLPVTRDTIVSQLVPFPGGEIEIAGLADGRRVIATTGALVITDRDGIVDRTVELPFRENDTRTILAISRDETVAVTANAVVEIATGRVLRGDENMVYAACDPVGDRCVRWIEDDASAGDEARLRVERALDGALVEDVVVEGSTLYPAPADAEHATVDDEDDEDDEDDDADATQEDDDDEDSPYFPVYGLSVELDGGRIVFTVDASDREFVCTAELASSTPPRCRDTGRDTRVVHVSASRGRAILAAPGLVSIIDASTLERAAAEVRDVWLDDVARDGSTMFVYAPRGVGRILDGRTAEPVTEDFDTSAVAIVLGDRGAYAALGPDDVRFFGPDAAAGVATFARPLWSDDTSARIGADFLEARLGPAGLDLFDRLLGVARVRPGDSNVAFGGPRVGSICEPRVSEGRLFVDCGPSGELEVRREGVGDAVRPSDVSAEGVPAPPVPEGMYESALAAGAHEARPDARWAYVRRDRLSVFDASATRVGHEVRIPRRALASGCDRLDFFVRGTLILHGDARCRTTLLDYAHGRATELATARVEVAVSSDGLRGAWLANDRITFVDGESGRDIRTLVVDVLGPHRFEITRDGRLLDVADDRTRAVVDLDAVFGASPASDPTRLVAEFPASWRASYEPALDRLVGCDRGTLVVQAPFDASTRRELELASCVQRYPDMVPELDVAGIGAVVVSSSHGITLVRLRDGAAITLAVLAWRDEIEQVLFRDDSVIALDPVASPLVVARDPTTRAVLELTGAEGGVDAALADFFADP